MSSARPMSAATREVQPVEVLDARGG
jgi:hypothetical protein